MVPFSAEMRASLRVAVLMGGPSGEHDISLKSGRGIAEALSRRGWQVKPITIPKILSVDAACLEARKSLQADGIDVAFLALHGPFGEDGAIQAVCESMHLAYTGSSSQTSRLGMDKVASKKRFQEAGLAVPAGVVIDWQRHPRVPGGVNLPVVVKPAGQGSSLGVSIVRAQDALEPAIVDAARYDPRVMIETFIQGREVTAGVFGEETLPVVEVRPRHGFFDFESKYTVGMTDYLVPAPLPAETAAAVQAAGLSAHRALGCRHLSRTDLILTEQGVPVVLEINTIPGFTPTSLVPKAAACLGMSYDDLCEQLVVMAWNDAHVQV
jgi:D-alanine-D-alanine ligase